MPFSPGDERINRRGRIEKKEKPTPRKIKERELISLLRKIKPSLSLAINTVTSTMRNENSTEAGKLKAAALMLQYYKDLIKEVYGVDVEIEEDNPEEIDANKAPVFSMKIINKED